MAIKRADLLLIYGTYRAIGEVFAPENMGRPLTKQAVDAWGEELPELREWQLRRMIPDIDKRIDKAKRDAVAAA